jgi:hypothetical protein
MILLRAVNCEELSSSDQGPDETALSILPVTTSDIFSNVIGELIDSELRVSFLCCATLENLNLDLHLLECGFPLRFSSVLSTGRRPKRCTKVLELQMRHENQSHTAAESWFFLGIASDESKPVCCLCIERSSPGSCILCKNRTDKWGPTNTTLVLLLPITLSQCSAIWVV